MTGNIMLKFNNKLQKKYLNKFLWNHMPQRFQTTVHHVTTNESNSFRSEWQNAKSYEEIPSQSKIAGLLNYLPGGKYYKMGPAELMMALKRDYGDITRLHGYFGRDDMVVTHNVDDFVTVLRNEGIWPTRPMLDAVHYYRHEYRRDFFQGVEGIITTRGEKWATFRSAVNPVLMQPRNVRLYMYKISQVNRELMERIRQIRDPKSLEVPDNFIEELNRWTLESISVVALDKQLGLITKNRGDPLVKELFQAINDFFKYGMEVEYRPSTWKYYKTKSFRNLMQSLDSMLNLTNTYVNEAIKRLEQEKQKGVPEKPEHEKSVLEKLIKIDKKLAIVMAMDLLMAGVDTTSSTFTGLLLCLAKNPAKQAKLREEILKILPHKDSEFTEESLKNIPYLRACLKESLRMYPIVIGNTRIPVHDVVLSGYRIPKGTAVTMASIALNYDEFYYPRAKEYIPERWLRTEKLSGDDNSTQCPHSLRPSNPFVYLPFGFGPRTCIGRRIVEMELELGIARLIRNFQVEFNYSTDNAFKSLMINKYCTKFQKIRLQSTATAETLSNKEWENAKPFEEIPSISTFSFIKKFLPGGSYAKLDFAQLMLAFKEDFGSVARLPGFFGRPEFVITHNVEDFEKVLRNEGIWPERAGSEALQYHRHVHRAEFFQGVEGLISTQGKSWGTFRSAVNPVMMQPKNVRLYLHKMSQVNKEFIERIRQIRDQQTLEFPDNFEEEMNRFTLESISVVALDKQLGLITEKRDNPQAMELFSALNGFFMYSVDVEFKPSIWKYYKTPTFMKLMKSLDTIVDVTSSYVNEAIERLEQERKNGVPEKPDNEKSVLEKLIKLDKKIATVMAMDMLMAGVDTTTSSFAALMLCLAKNPEQQEKLRQEVLKILPQKDSEFNENSLKNIPYLRACIKESQRIYPLTVGNARAPVKDVVISGYRVPKGTHVSMCSLSLMRDAKHYARPNEFLPERWLRSNTEDESATKCPNASLKPTSPFLHLPFGFGARSCIGRRIVEMELELVTARLVRNYQLEFNYPTDNAFKSLAISVPNIPLKFKFTDYYW
ncbi:Cytochrome P450 CYP12A2 [Lucilia cuprina]|nr:Cytochrome P450 CYP12A2 [Lucilia cuprina]